MMARIGMTFAALALMGAGLAADNPVPPAPDGEWLPLAPQSLYVAKGDPLDFSTLVPARAAGSDGALMIGSDGRLHLGGDADPRFNCGMLANGPNQSWTFPTHAEADALAVQMRRHGYNLVRFHFMDVRLVRGAPKGQSVNPESLDRYFYLLAALKRNGIYWMLDIMTAPNGDRTQIDAARSVNDMKARVNFDAKARDNWLRMMREVYAAPNPYTGKSLLADPALAFVVGANENSLGFWLPLAKDGPYPAGLAALFDKWVRLRHAGAAALSTAVPDLTLDESSGKAPVAPPISWKTPGPRMALFRGFLSSLEVDTYKWMTNAMLGEGYRGPVIGYPEWYWGLDNRTRAALPITDLHAYVGEVTSYDKGTRLKLTSMMEDEGLNDWLGNTAGRWLDRSLVLSEYGSPFPNPNRRESGLLFPAVSAFQGYSAICQMASMAVEPSIPEPGPRIKPITPYAVGLDPVARVTETLSTMLFYRRDVAEATGPGVAIPFGEAEMANPGSGLIPRPIKRAALLVKLGLIPPEKIDSLPENTQIVPIGAPPQGMVGKAMDRLVSATGTPQQRTDTLVAKLFSAGLLPKDNRTSVAKGVYQSATGETLLDQTRGLITVTTARTEAVNSIGATTDVALNSLSVTSLDRGALVAATALDGKPLKDSGRILLMLAGDARNSQMALAGNGTYRNLVDWGTLPILLQRVVAKVSLQANAPSAWHFSVLALNGKVIGSSDIKPGPDGRIALTLDTAAVRSAPTTYFLLERSAASASTATKKPKG